MSKPFTHDSKWVEAKKRCQLNQDDIAKAKALGLSPKTLMKNIPSPQQKWKLPVKFWIRELYEEKFGDKNRGVGAKGRKPKASSAKKSGNSATPFFTLHHGGKDFLEDDEFSESLEDILPIVPLEDVAQFYFSNDPEWQTHRLGRRQINLRWTASALAVALKEIEAVEAIVLFGSVAKSVLEGPADELWEDPQPRTPCRDLDLAIWITRCDDTVLRAIAVAVNQTLRSLAERECITLDWVQLDLHILEAKDDTERFLGRLRPPASDASAPTLELPPGFVLDPDALIEPPALILFEREPPPADAATDDDCPF